MPSYADQASLTAMCLKLGKSLDQTSMLLFGVAFLVLWLPSLHAWVAVGLALSMLLGCVQKYYALRVALDAQVFAHWAQTWSQHTEDQVHASLQRFDASLQACGLSAQKSGSVRAYADRQRGAQRLWYKQALLLGVQVVVLMLSLLWHWL